MKYAYFAVSVGFLAIVAGFSAFSWPLGLIVGGSLLLLAGLFFDFQE